MIKVKLEAYEYAGNPGKPLSCSFCLDRLCLNASQNCNLVLQADNVLLAAGSLIQTGSLIEAMGLFWMF